MTDYKHIEPGTYKERQQERQRAYVRQRHFDLIVSFMAFIVAILVSSVVIPSLFGRLWPW